jgi:hypothetical protein
MKNIGEVLMEPDLVQLATESGFTEIHQIDREYGTSPLFYARWKGAPFGMTQVTETAGHLGVAFYQGKIIPTPEGIIGGDFIHSGWDDLPDTSVRDPAALLVIARAILDFRAGGREILYRDIPMPEMPNV